MERDEAGSDEAVLRQRIEFRAGLAIAAAVALVLLCPLLMWASTVQDLSRWGTAVVGVPVLATLIATWGLTGWWIDSLRDWWGPHRWIHQRRSVANWLVPVVNVVAPPLEAGLVFDAAGRSEAWGRWWMRSWMAIVVVSVFRIRSAPWASGLAVMAAGALVLWLLISSMRSLRAEWRRRDAAAASAQRPAFG